MKLNNKTSSRIITVLFIISMLVAAVMYRYRVIVESFAQCVYRPFGKRIDSIYVDMSLNTVAKTNKQYEIPLSEFQLLIESIPFVSMDEFLRKLNTAPSIRRYQTERNPFKVIYNYKNEFLLYREPKAFGYHVRVDSNKSEKRVKVLGVVTSYDIYSKYIQNLDKRYHNFEKIIGPDTNKMVTNLNLGMNRKIQ